MQPLFREKISKFGAGISLMVLAVLTALFAAALPEALLSVSGRIFAGVWVVMAILLFAAHIGRFNAEKRFYRTGWLDEGRRKTAAASGQRRMMRG
jgi:hypothetical protein